MFSTMIREALLSIDGFTILFLFIISRIFFLDNSYSWEMCLLMMSYCERQTRWCNFKWMSGILLDQDRVNSGIMGLLSFGKRMVFLGKRISFCCFLGSENCR